MLFPHLRTLTTNECELIIGFVLLRYGDYWQDVSMLTMMAVGSIIYAYYSLWSKMKW